MDAANAVRTWHCWLPTLKLTARVDDSCLESMARYPWQRYGFTLVPIGWLAQPKHAMYKWIPLWLSTWVWREQVSYTALQRSFDHTWSRDMMMMMIVDVTGLITIAYFILFSKRTNDKGFKNLISSFMNCVSSEQRRSWLSPTFYLVCLLTVFLLPASTIHWLKLVG